MKTDDLENELRNLKFTHLTESELAAYCEQALDKIGSARVEAHVKQCFICERQLELLREENAALTQGVTTAADVAFVERRMEQTRPAPESSPAGPAEVARESSLQERLTEYLQQMVASWRICFGHGAMRGEIDQGEEAWRWQSEDGKLQAHAIMEKNADLTVHISSNEMELEGARLNIRLGATSHEITLRRVSESEVDARVAIPWRQRPRNMADITIERV